MDLKGWFDGLTAAKVLAMEGDAESQVLDCKGEPRNDKNDNRLKELLAKAISGFANATGGVILWGVDARKDDRDVDCIGSFPGLDDAERFASRLHELTPQAVAPGVSGVEHRVLLREGERGFVVTYIPATDGGPHMARFQDDRYYQRIGQSFMRMEPFQIADMFGRRARPVLQVSARWESTTSIPIFLENTGRGAALAPYLMLEIESPFERASHAHNQLEIVRHDSQTSWMHGAGAEFVIHPGTSVKAGGLALKSIRLMALEGRLPKECVIKYRTGALDVAMTEGVLRLDVPQAITTL